MSNWHTANPRAVGPTRYKNDNQITAADIPGVLPDGLPPIPGVIPGDRQVAQEPPAQPDPAPEAYKEPIFIGPVVQKPNTVTAIKPGFSISVPNGYSDYVYNPADFPYDTSGWQFNEVVVPPPPTDNRGGITYLLDNLDQNPLAVAITGFVLGTIGGIAPGSVGAVVSTTIGVVDVVTSASWRIDKGSPTIDAQRTQKVTVNSAPTGLTVGGIPNISTWNTTAYTTYKRIPLTASLIMNTITIRGFTMDFKNTGLAETAQIDINVPVACNAEFFYPPNDDDSLMGEEHYYQMWGTDSAGATQTALAKVKMLHSGSVNFPAGYRDTVNIEIPNFPVTVAPSGSLYLPTITLEYITRLDTTFMREFLGMIGTF